MNLGEKNPEFHTEFKPEEKPQKSAKKKVIENLFFFVGIFLCTFPQFPFGFAKRRKNTVGMID